MPDGMLARCRVVELRPGVVGLPPRKDPNHSYREPGARIDLESDGGAGSFFGYPTRKHLCNSGSRGCCLLWSAGDCSVMLPHNAASSCFGTPLGICGARSTDPEVCGPLRDIGGLTEYPSEYPPIQLSHEP